MGAAIGGSIKSKEASTLLTLVENRSGVQLAAAEGSAKNMDFGFIGAIVGGAGAVQAVQAVHMPIPQKVR